MTLLNPVTPMIVFCFLFLLKVSLMRIKYPVIKVVMVISFLASVYCMGSYVDQDKENDVVTYALAICISLIICGQAWMDFAEYKWNTDPKQRMFYLMNNPMRKVWVGSNVVTTILFSCAFFHWMWKTETNSSNLKGFVEDEINLHLSMGSMISYLVFLTSRTGHFVHDMFQS